MEILERKIQAFKIVPCDLTEIQFWDFQKEKKEQMEER